MEVDIKGQLIRNMSRAGTVHKTYNVSDLEYIYRVEGRLDTIDLRFSNANHPYRLTFPNTDMESGIISCEQFYQLLCLLKSRQEIGRSTMIGNHMHSVLEDGLEHIKVMVGTFNLGGYQPPPLLDEWLPLDAQHDIYAIGVQVTFLGKFFKDINLSTFFYLGMLI